MAAGVGGFETYAKMLEEYQRDTMLNFATLGSYGLIKGGYGFYSSAYENMKRDGIVIGAINTINPFYHLAVLGADVKIAADNGDWKGVGGAVAKAGVAVVGMIVGAKAGAKIAGGVKGVTAGEAGAFGPLRARAVPGDKLTPHHMPQAALGFTSRDAGGALVLQESEHVLTRTYGWRGGATAVQDVALSFRDALARDIRDVRRIVGTKYDSGIRDLLGYYRQNFPHLIQQREKP